MIYAPNSALEVPRDARESGSARSRPSWPVTYSPLVVDFTRR